MGTVILVLLGSLPTSLAAQDPDKATWAAVTGTAHEEEWVGDSVNDPGHLWVGSVESIPGSSGKYTVEWSDPRLPTTLRIQQDAAVHHGDLASWDDWMWLFAIAARLDGPDGAWTGSGHGVFGTDGERGLVVLSGEGAYEGLSALLDITWTGVDYTVLEFEGWIFESALPAMPDPLEPPSSESWAALAAARDPTTTRPRCDHSLSVTGS